MAPTTRPIEEAPVIREATVVAFWLPASDTLKQGEGADLLDDFRAYTGVVSPLLDQQGIKLETTTADSVVVELENGPRRVIRLSGLDYPFGYVLVEPGYPETILTGVSTDDELLEQVSWYFGLDEDADSSDAAVTRTSVSLQMLPVIPKAEAPRDLPDVSRDHAPRRDSWIPHRAAPRDHTALEISVSHHVTHPLRQDPGGEGFLQEGGVRQEAAVLEDRVVGVARDVENRQLR